MQKSKTASNVRGLAFLGLAGLIGYIGIEGQKAHRQPQLEQTVSLAQVLSPPDETRHIPIIQTPEPTLYDSGIKEAPKLPYKTNPQMRDDYEARLRVFAAYTKGFEIGGNEGKVRRVHDPLPNDGKDEPTIGVGHYMDRGNSRETFAKALPEVNWSAVRYGKESLTDEQVERLFAHDLREHVPGARRLITNFEDLPVYAQMALVDMNYRGGLADSPTFLKLFNEGNIAEAAVEYLDRKEYKEAKAQNKMGIKTRIDSQVGLLVEYANSLNQSAYERFSKAFK